MSSDLIREGEGDSERGDECTDERCPVASLGDGGVLAARGSVKDRRVLLVA